ncbi:MAG TPA: alpha/beta hydrolase [Ignavibacteriaceae bacterium]|nr:alpha/beta hydrolase [Ignavibacteriaceae bacterium]
MKFFFDNKYFIDYDKTGSGKLNLILLHGYGTSKETWRYVRPLLEKDYTLYLLDMKGFGLSSKPKDKRYTAADQAVIINAFIANQNLNNVVIVGHSFGGAVALYSYLADKTRIKKIILVDPSIYLTKLPFIAIAAKFPLVKWFIMYLVPNKIKARISLRFLIYKNNPIPEENVEKFAAYLKTSGAYNAFIQTANLMVPYINEELSPRLKEINIPVQIIWGKNDPLLPYKQALKLRDEIPPAVLHLVEDCGHIPQIEKPEEAVRVMKLFLNA